MVEDKFEKVKELKNENSKFELFIDEAELVSALSKLLKIRRKNESG